MATSIDYDDRDLQRLFAELEPKRRVQALKGGFRREANQVRKTAINNLRSSINSSKDLEKGVRAIVFKRKAGFRVTVRSRASNLSRQGVLQHRPELQHELSVREGRPSEERVPFSGGSLAGAQGWHEGDRGDAPGDASPDRRAESQGQAGEARRVPSGPAAFGESLRAGNGQG